MAGGTFTPNSAAILLTHWLNALETAGVKRFPVNVEHLALQVGEQLKWPDPIFEVAAANIPNFDGGLFHVDGRGWALLYNERVKSEGRVRYTQAHELGHYMLHRLKQAQFECTKADMVHLGDEQKAIEAEADEFASNLLMPMKQFREVTDANLIDFDLLSDASGTFGVSLTSAALRWVQSTTESAVLVLSRDGFMDWSVSSDRARKNGAFFRTKGKVVQLPPRSLAADETTGVCRTGETIALNDWFPSAHAGARAREMKVACDNYGYTLSLLHLSAGDTVWEPRQWS